MFNTIVSFACICYASVCIWRTKYYYYYYYYYRSSLKLTLSLSIHLIDLYFS